MTAPSQDVAGELRARIAELEQELQSGATENGRLQHELSLARERQEASAEILHTVAGASGNARQSLQRIAETSGRLFGAPSVSIQLAENGQWGEAFRYGTSAQHIRSTVPLSKIAVGGQNLPGQVITRNEQIDIPDLDHIDPSMAEWPGLPLARAAGTRTMCGTPLRRDGKAIGALIIYRDRLQPFTPEELALQQSFADQAVIAIENARLFNETQQALERQTATAEVLKVIASSPSNLQPVFDAIVKRSNRLIGGHSTTVIRIVGDMAELAAFTPVSPEADAALRARFPAPIASADPQLERVRRGNIGELADVEAEGVHEITRSLGRLRGWRSRLMVPLRGDDDVIGVISITRKEPGSFAEQHVALLQTFADQAVIAIENVRLFEQVQARTRDLTEALQQQTATADVLKVISRSAFDLKAVLDALLASACRLCEADIGTIRYEDGGNYRLAATYGCKPEWVDHFAKYSTAADRSSIFGRTILDGHVVHVPDVLMDPDYRRPEAQKLMGFRAALGVPLVREGHTFGVINLFRCAVGSFQDKQIDLVATFADQAVIAIENVRLFDEVQAKTRDLEESLRYQTGSANILKVIASSPTDVGPVMNAIVESACELCEAADAVVLLRDGNEVLFGAQHGSIPMAWRRQPIDRRLPSGRAMVDCKPVHVHDLLGPEGEEFPIGQELARRSAVRTILSVPLLREGESIGAIALRRTEVNPFNEKQIALLQTFADQAVIAIGNVRLFEQVQAKTRELQEALTYQTGSANILKVIASSPTDVEPALKAIVESACELCDAYDAAVVLQDGDDLRFSAHHGPIPIGIEKWPINRNWTAGRAFIDQTPVHVEDLSDESQADFPDGREFAIRMGHRTILSVPLLREKESIGAIVLRRKEVHPFTEKQITLLKTFADQAVIAIGNVHLFEEVQARTRELALSLDELRAAQDRLVQTEKLASLGQLTAGIAHEIKNPLNFVNNFAALSAELTDELNDVLASASMTEKISDEVDELTGLLKDNLQKIVQHGKRADSIVKNMLLHSREGSGEHRPTDVNALVEESLNLAYHGARAERPQFNVTLRRELDPAAGTAELFPQEITRVLLNLITNGFYAVAKRGAENGTGFEPVLSASTRDRGAHIEIRIRDNGTGIPPEVKEKMFNPFFTTKPAGEGTGLGLSMSHDIIVKQHGGTIDVATAPGEFTEFTILLPRNSSFLDKNRG